MSSCSEKCMGTKDVYNHGKKGNWYKKQPHCYIQKADFRRAEENSFLWRLRTFFLFFVSLDILSSGLKFPWSYFLILFWQPPFYFRKRRPISLKLRTLFPKTFFPRRSENWDFFTKVFIARFFFHKLFFLRLSYIDSNCTVHTVLYILYTVHLTLQCPGCVCGSESQGCRCFILSSSTFSQVFTT